MIRPVIDQKLLGASPEDLEKAVRYAFADVVASMEAMKIATSKVSLNFKNFPVALFGTIGLHPGGAAEDCPACRDSGELLCVGPL